MNVQDLVKALPVCFETNITMLITGAHGTGKSQGVRQAVEGQGIGKTWDFRLGQMADTGDIIGLLDIEDNAPFCKFKIPERIHQVVKYCEENPDKYGVLFFDEMNRTTKDILQAIFQIVLDHELNGLKFPDNMKAVCAINPATDDYAVLDFDDKAFADRFCHVKFEPSVKDWLTYARKEGVSADITSFIGEHNEALEEETQGFDLPAKPSRRTWCTVDRLINNCHDKAIFQELLIGMVGIETASMFIDYRNKQNESIKALDVLNSYSKVKEKVKRFSSNEVNRGDILRNVCDLIKVELEKIETMPKKWEKNLSAFFCDIPRDLGMGVLNEFFNIASFISTETTEKVSEEDTNE
jgi:hypothetical protein